jgi:hypothetical protein
MPRSKWKIGTKMHSIAPLFVPNKIALSTLGPRQMLQNLSTYPRFGGREGVNGKTINQRSELLRFTHLAIVR